VHPNCRLPDFAGVTKKSHRIKALSSELTDGADEQGHVVVLRSAFGEVVSGGEDAIEKLLS
jgi:hypothetical protein